jgi:hypothetical protein
VSDVPDWPLARRQGFALAAAICGDSDARLAEPGLGARLREDATGVARELSALPRGERRRWMRRRLRRGAVPKRAPQDMPPPRALSLLATRVAPELGKRWLAQAPLPRAGFVAEPALIELLARIAARGGDGPAT